MPGFGRGGFGVGGFGQWPWALEAIAGSVPEIYQDQDQEVGNGRLAGLLQVVGQSLDDSRKKIRDYDQLRDPFLAPTDQTFSEPVQILRVDDLGDGTSRVFLSVGDPSLGNKFDRIRLGQTLQDYTTQRFDIVEIHQAELPTDFVNPPIDPATSQPTGKNIVVNNVSLGTQQTVPQVSGTLISNENPTSGQFLHPYNVDDGTNPPPYIFTVLNAPIAGNLITVSWSEGGVAHAGTFTNKGQPTGDLGVGSAVNFSSGLITIYTDDQMVVDANTIVVSYTYLPGIIPEDGTVNSQHILAFLGEDFAVALDRHDPEAFQRSYVNHSFQLWDIKGTADGYTYMGAIAGFFVRSFPLYRIADYWIPFLPVIDVFQLSIPGVAGGPFPYTDIDPLRAAIDEVPADLIPTDLLSIDSLFPSVVQSVTVTSTTVIRTEGTDFRSLVICTPNVGEMLETLQYPQAIFVDFNGKIFDVENPIRIDSTTYSFEVLAPNTPATGAATVTWRSIMLRGTIITLSTPANGVIDFGPQYTGYTGHRVRVLVNMDDAGIAPYLAPVALGNWGFIDQDGNVSWVETMSTDVTETILNVEFVSTAIPTQGDRCAVFYVPQILPDCDFCRASVLRILMTPDAILADPAALADQPDTRLVSRLKQMVPAHIRFTQFVYDPGPGIAVYPTILASSSINEDATDSTDYTPLYDDPNEWPADDIVDDAPFMQATADTNSVDPFILEEHVDGSLPLLNGWTATGYWRVGTTRPSGESYFMANGLKPSGSALFVYGIEDPTTPFHNRIDLASKPNSGTLTSPLISAVVSATAVRLEFWHYADFTAAGIGTTNFLPTVDILNSSNTVLHHFTKTNVGNTDAVGYTVRAGSGYGSPAQWQYLVLDITAYVVGAGQFRVRWNFDTVTATVPSAAEGWFVDDIVVRVVP